MKGTIQDVDGFVESQNKFNLIIYLLIFYLISVALSLKFLNEFLAFICAFLIGMLILFISFSYLDWPIVVPKEERIRSSIPLLIFLIIGLAIGYFIPNSAFVFQFYCIAISGSLLYRINNYGYNANVILENANFFAITNWNDKGRFEWYEKKLIKNNNVIYLKDYPKFLVYFARKHTKNNNVNVKDLEAKHQVLCANCGTQYTKEALSHLFVISQFTGDISIVGETLQGNEFRSGKCPNCGYDKIRIVTSD